MSGKANMTCIFQKNVSTIYDLKKQVVVSLNNMVTADVDLKVKMPPVITEDDTPVKRVVAGKPFDLACEASGYPTPTITW